jgi:hypothetical protein
MTTTSRAPLPPVVSTVTFLRLLPEQVGGGGQVEHRAVLKLLTHSPRDIAVFERRIPKPI